MSHQKRCRPFAPLPAAAIENDLLTRIDLRHALHELAGRDPKLAVFGEVGDREFEGFSHVDEKKSLALRSVGEITGTSISFIDRSRGHEVRQQVSGAFRRPSMGVNIAEGALAGVVAGSLVSQPL